VGPLNGKTEKDGYTFFTLRYNDTDVEAAFKGSKIALKRQESWESFDEVEASSASTARRLKEYKAPVAEATFLAEQATGLKKADDGSISGDLSQDAIKQLMMRRSNQADPENAKGSVKFWIKDGVLSKYEYNIQGRIKGQNDENVDVNRTTLVEIKDIGSTKVSVPDEAKKKLS
jgi:hypothetical protein